MSATGGTHLVLAEGAPRTRWGTILDAGSSLCDERLHPQNQERLNPSRPGSRICS